MPQLYLWIWWIVYLEHTLINLSVFIDNILIYFSDYEMHAIHLRLVLETLRTHWLFEKLSKCSFWLKEVAFLGHVISIQGVAVDLGKIEAMISWPRPCTVSEIRGFLGLAGYYHRIVHGFSHIVVPLTRLIKKWIPLEWSDDCKRCFGEIK